jgi:hypothetical protein
MPNRGRENIYIISPDRNAFGFNSSLLRQGAVEQNSEWFIQYPAHLVSKTMSEKVPPIAWCPNPSAVQDEGREKERLLRKVLSQFFILVTVFRS